MIIRQFYPDHAMGKPGLERLDPQPIGKPDKVLGGASYRYLAYLSRLQPGTVNDPVLLSLVSAWLEKGSPTR